MMKTKLIVLVAMAAMLSMDPSVHAQQQASRGTAKVRSRLFNPFDVTGSQISVDRFGIVTFQSGTNPAAASVMPHWATAAAFSGVLAPTAPITSLAAVGTSSATLSVAPASGSLQPAATSADLAFGASVRPPYRPPVRSPFRPPPRPPF